jgi:hypothetical protein
LYKEQFDRGLRAWEEAEERFFIRRIEWEQDTLRLFSEGEELWFAAFDKLNEEYQKWELKAKELFDSGERLFKNLSDSLEKSIADAKAEFETNKNARVGTGTEKAKALVDMYITSASAAISAKENLQYWLNSYCKEKEEKNVNDPDFTDWLRDEKTSFWVRMEKYFILNQEIKSKIQDVISGKMTPAEEAAFVEEIKGKYFFSYKKYSSLCDLEKQYKQYVSYMEIALGARDKILADYAELLGTGALKDILSPGASSEDFYLDEYQLALVRAKTLVLYWERKASVAQAVMSYSENIDAGRMTETESIQAWEKAKDDYNKSLVLYETEMNKLGEIGADIQKQTAILSELAKKMSEEEEKLSRLSQEHSMLLAACATSIKSIVTSDLNNRYKFLADEYKFFLKTGKEASYREILEYGMTWGIVRQNEDAQKLLELLINGDNSGAPPLAELKNIVDLNTRLAAIDLFADGPDYKLRSFDSAYSGADWYSKAKGIDLSENQKTALYGEKLWEQLSADFNSIQLILLEKRFDFELKALKTVLDMDAKSENYETDLVNALSGLKIYNVEDVAYIYNILLSLRERINSNNELFTEDYNENEIIEYFITMGSFCNNTEQALEGYYNDYYYCSNLLDIYYNYAAISSFGQKENWKSSCDYIKVFLADYGLNADQYFLPDAQSIYEAIIKRNGGLTVNSLTENIFLFFDEFQKCFSLVPEWLENEIYLWKNAVIDFIATNIPFSNNEAVNEKHWREFLDGKNITNLDPLLTRVSTWQEGVTEDARFVATYYTNRLNDALDLYSQTNSPASILNAEALYNYYTYAASEIDNRFYSLNFYYDDIYRLGKALEISELSDGEKTNQRDVVNNELKIQEEIFDLARDNYFLQAEIFLNIGNSYDGQYKVVKKAYENTEVCRFEYEKEDAIRRWASTAYLNTDTINYDNCKNNLEKANIALAILSEINNGKEKRVNDEPEYNALYLEYEQGFLRKIKALDAFENVSSALVQEYNNKETYINAYKYYLLNFGALTSVYSDSISIELINDWQHKDIITVKDGKLAFSKNSSWEITADSNDLELDSFFTSTKIIDGGTHEISTFEEALKELSQRMAVYLSNPNKLRQWNAARDYILATLTAVNPNLNYLSEHITGMGELRQNGSLGRELKKSGVLSSAVDLYSYFNPNDVFAMLRLKSFLNPVNYFNPHANASIYSSLSETEKADLEFYVILTLLGSGNNYISGFSEILTLDLYQAAYDKVNDDYKYAAKMASKWYTFKIYNGMRDINKNTLNRIIPVLDRTRNKVNAFVSGVSGDISAIQKYNDLYLTSCNNIKILNGEKEDGESIVWDDINNALAITGKFNSDDISILKSCWEKMQEISFVSCQNINTALSELVRWTRSEETRSRNDLEIFMLADMQNQQNNENDYFTVTEAFLSGTANINDLRAAAEKAYGKNSAVQKNHFENIQSVLIKDLSLYLTMENDFYSEFSSLGRDIELLTGKTMENRYAAELLAREIEWNQMRADILIKANEWQNSVSIILEKGRTEWDAGKKKMNESYKQWGINFQNEIRRVEDEWALAYLAGLEDKDEWLEQAESAFNQASAESFLRLVGTEGERLSRFIDTREPFGVRNAVPEAQAIMTELLQSSGIVNMAKAFGNMNNIADTAAFSVRKGLGGFSSWDAAVAKTAAKDIARKTNAELADAESRKIAHSAKTTINDIIGRLYSNVDDANKNFNESMDNKFIMNGLWRRNGTNYEKDIVKGSTLFQPVISQKQIIASYKNYMIEPVSLKSDLDEKHLAELNTIAIRALIENAYDEVNAITKEIFGIGEDKIFIEKTYTENRELSPGKFGGHIGYQPAVKHSAGSGDSRGSIFDDEGEGEMGRLISDFIYWKIIDAKGSAEIGLPFWEKRMWNDENSFFTAPSISSTFKVAGAIAASIVSVVLTPVSGGASLGLLVGTAALVAGINSSSDLLFSTLNAAFGYKSFGEAFFDFQKSSLINIGSAAISGVFGSGANGLTSTAVNAASSTAGKVLTQTAMSGLQTVASSMSSNVLGAITYNSENGFSWSKESFSSGMKSMFTDTLTSMASTFTTQSLTAINSGFDKEKLYGFSQTNMNDLGKFNNLAGSFAGQGLNYAMGNDFTLNTLNLSLFTKSNTYSGGLLELHLGREGNTMNFGTGGANVSIDNLMSAFKGLQVWNVNSRISSFIKNNDFDSAISLRNQYGFGDGTQKSQLWEILDGKTKINTDAEGDYTAKTVRDDNGNRVINLSGYQSGMSEEDQLRLGVILGHEAYRDGYETDDNYIETRTAVLAHTEMAIRMYMGGYESVINDQLAQDINAYLMGTDYFNAYIDNNYDSSEDYWKLVVRNGVAGFEWDGKYTFDLSAMNGYGVVDKLDEKALKAMWELGDKKTTFEDFKKAVGAFDTFNTSAIALEKSLQADNKELVTKASVNQQITDFMNALKTVDTSGLLMRTDAKIVKPENGTRVFADGIGIMTSDFGIRAIDFKGTSVGFGGLQWHGAWDLSKGENLGLVAPMNGALSLDFNVEGGLKITTTGEDKRSVTYTHSSGDSLKYFIEAFASNGVTLNNGKLNGIVQNMVIGVMGNTGTWSTGAHVHLTYAVNGIDKDPALFFDKSQFKSDPYTRLMSGLSNNPDKAKFQYTDSQITNMFNYFYNKDKTNYEQNLSAFANITNQASEFNKYIEFRQTGKYFSNERLYIKW